MCMNMNFVEIEVKTEQEDADDDGDVEMYSKPVVEEVVKENAPGTLEVPKKEYIQQEVAQQGPIQQEVSGKGTIQQEVAGKGTIQQEVAQQEDIQQEHVKIEPESTIMEDAPQVETKAPPMLSCKHPVMHLNELRKGLEYNLVAEEDEGKEKMYTYGVSVDGELFQGKSKSKKGAKSEAAKYALLKCCNVLYVPGKFSIIFILVFLFTISVKSFIVVVQFSLLKQKKKCF